MLLIDQMMHLPSLLGALLVMVLMTVVGLIIWQISFRFLGSSQPKESRRAANYLFRAVAILVSLFLSLTFADVMMEMNQIEASIERDAIMIEDIYYDLDRYDTPRADIARQLIVDYTRAVIEHDWPALAHDRLSNEAREILHNLEDTVLRLEDHSELQGILRTRIIAEVDAISDARLNRLEQALAKPPLFLVVAIFGVMTTMVCFGAQPPNRLTTTLLSLYTLLIGLVIYLILAYSDPFQGATAIRPVSLEYVLETMEG